MTGERLEPCPFCGGQAEIWRAHSEPYHRKAWIACMGHCGGRVRGTVLTTEYETDAEAIAAWNTRSLPTALDTVIAEVEAMSKDQIYSAIDRESEPIGYRGVVLNLLRALRAEHSAGEGEDG